MKQATVVLIAIGLISFGPTAVFAPGVAADAYGIPLTSVEATAYLRAAAVRDVALGCWLLALVWYGVAQRILAVSLLAVALVAGGDAMNVMLHSGWQSARSLTVHAAGLIGLLVIAGWLWLDGRTAGGP